MPRRANPRHATTISLSFPLREMTKQMLKVVKLAEKEKYVSDFESLDFIGRKELPCVKALQEAYASKYPVLLNQVSARHGDGPWTVCMNCAT